MSKRKVNAAAASNETLMTQARYAALRQVSPGLVSKWRSRGWLVLRDGMVDVPASDKLVDANRDPKRVGEIRSKPNRSGGDRRVVAMAAIADARVRSENAYADKIERENLVAQGALVDKAGTLRAAEAMGTALRERLAALPGRMSTRIAALVGRETREIYSEIETEVESLQQTIADALRAMKEAEGAS